MTVKRKARVLWFNLWLKAAWLLFMIWQRQRAHWQEHCLGSLPRDVLFLLCSYLG